jgi:hemerythrin-like metal-binding protein
MIRWNPSLAIGVPEIDDQHQASFEYVTRVEDAVHAGHFNYRVEEIFNFLSAHAEKHFEAEERLTQETDYPGLAGQVLEHRGSPLIRAAPSRQAGRYEASPRPPRTCAGHFPRRQRLTSAT